MSKEDSICENLFIKTTTRDNDGRFSVRIPLSESADQLGDSYSQAESRFLALERNANLTYEEFSTILAQIEAVLNSRPMYPLSADPADLLPLSPSLFLIGRPLTAPACPGLTTTASHRLSRYDRVEQMRQQFWQRWSKEYIAELQTRTKWKTRREELVPNTLVLIKEDNLPPLKWRLGRILHTFPGKDGLSRVADIKTATGTVRRAFSKICPLLSQEEEKTTSSQ
ncbi:uncharacterized protein LOC113500285 [Trichoplusia ni]|uniref:Uncharacterized protein LOC113500285 n=1 Tax=Trichoplusia ni TaxID=7111 RepID=A0A7E5W805_TRINI|nr:uncharacterized protein LOC113500285 [Trichoplusia ni]